VLESNIEEAVPLAQRYVVVPGGSLRENPIAVSALKIEAEKVLNSSATNPDRKIRLTARVFYRVISTVCAMPRATLLHGRVALENIQEALA
jgi:hypothetical protein